MNTFARPLEHAFRPAIRHIGLIFLDITAMFLTVASAAFIYVYLETPKAALLGQKNVPKTTLIYDRTGQHVLYEIHGEENRKFLSHDQIPDSMRVATIASEDDNFYYHPGIDVLSIMRALKNNIQNNEISQGGSTITQQLARNVFLSREKTLRRKILETILAIKIERKYTKAEILDMYLNEIPYGSNAYGIESAAETFFGKSAKDLTLDESAFIAALPKATTYYSPYGDHTKELIYRQKNILARIAQLGLADPKTVNEAKKVDTLAKVIPLKQKIEAPHFVFYIKDQLEKKYGKDLVENGGLRVYTTLDYDLQKIAEKVISDAAPYNLQRYGGSNEALVALSPKTGQILAMVGSKDYFDKTIDGQVNVTVSPRQPGSSFKPFAYAKAFEKGYQPETRILDAQTNFGPDGSGRNYIPRNYDGKFHGVVTMRQALAESLNVPAIKTLYLAGIDDTIELAHRLGITTLNERNRYGLSLVIGGGEVTLLDETAGYSVFANDGKRNIAKGILKITNEDGKVLETAQAENTPVLDPQIARKINSILSDNAARVPIFGPNNKLFIPGKVVAAKTGTTQWWKDGWTVGYTPSLAAGVWVGNNDSRPMKANADGSYVAAPIWNKFMTQALQNLPEESFIAYDQVPSKIQKTKNIITYFKKKSGEILSPEKAKKMDPDKIGVRIESLPEEQLAQTNSPSGLPDPMIMRWRQSLQSGQDLKDYLKQNNN